MWHHSGNECWDGGRVCGTATYGGGADRQHNGANQACREKIDTLFLILITAYARHFSGALFQRRLANMVLFYVCGDVRLSDKRRSFGTVAGAQEDLSAA